MHFDKTLKMWADSHETSNEIAQAIHDVAKGELNQMEKIWENGSEYVEILIRAWTMAEFDCFILRWGEKAIKRPLFDVCFYDGGIMVQLKKTWAAYYTNPSHAADSIWDYLSKNDVEEWAGHSEDALCHILDGKFEEKYSSIEDLSRVNRFDEAITCKWIDYSYEPVSVEYNRTIFCQRLFQAIDESK